jgi:hypothetical protein
VPLGDLWEKEERAGAPRMSTCSSISAVSARLTRALHETKSYAEARDQSA